MRKSVCVYKSKGDPGSDSPFKGNDSLQQEFLFKAFESLKIYRCLQGCSKVFTTGQARINPEHYM